MNKGNIEYINLEELSNTDYKIIDGETDITGWTIVDESDATVGKVRDLLFDPEQNAIRYLIVDLDESVPNGEEKAILLPIGITTLDGDKKRVVIPAMHKDQFAAMPQYIIGEVTRDTEMKIRSAIGSPAALRIEEEIAEMDSSEFYNHHHFDRGHLGSRTHEAQSITSPQDASLNTREEEENTIHELIERSGESVSHQAENQHHATDNFEAFDVQTGEGIFVIEPQENGTYRILNQSEKIGVIYAESGERGVEWKTMDQLDDRFVEVIGEGIRLHHQSTSNF
ncbi:hypothetical protein DHW03_03105 [Pedobacter yonginense]|uniref:PRC-barrel domain-containing protein n=1 Tax=Pedobacter yonginense TaxID=651869 RepID=A0A317ERW8_9SPHI|nr:PRC-barrel domain-containing protein [Pedobacter yonginense]PWS28837.1 hypothetical protein DHW03_03105 [Pedobacter yonginense]